MQKYKLITTAAMLSLTLSASSLLVRGDEPIYDAENDPLVSLSYITDVLTPETDKKIASAKSEFADDLIDFSVTVEALTDKLAALERQMTALKTENKSLRAEIESLKASDAILNEVDKALSDADKQLEKKISEEISANGYQVIRLTKGAKLLAESACEIILRSGTAIVISITINGVNDLSDGTELFNAENVPQYHSLLVPRGGDGRGIQVTSTESYIMVRGDYSIVN